MAQQMTQREKVIKFLMKLTPETRLAILGAIMELRGKSINCCK